MLDYKKEPNAHCNVVDNLFLLEQFGFKEDEFHRWIYTIDETEMFVKDIVASGYYLYLRNYDKYNDNKPLLLQNLTVLWNREIAGQISVSSLALIINFLNKGNVNK